MTFRFCSAPAKPKFHDGAELVTVFVSDLQALKARKLGSRLSSKSLASINLSISSASGSMNIFHPPSLWQFSDFLGSNGGHRRWHSWRSQTSVPSVKLSVKASKIHPGIQTDVALATSFHVSNLGLTSSRCEKSFTLRWKFQSK